MDEPRTHYQLSFTSRQALLLFIGLLVALGIAYVFGLLTGLAGRKAEETASAPPAPAVAPAATASPTAATVAESLELPKPVRGVSPRPGLGPIAAGRVPGSATRIAESAATPVPAAAATAAPSPSPGLQLFEDEGAAPPSAAARRPASAPAGPSARPAPRAPASSSFWVQALSATSEKEAQARREKLAAHGFRGAVVPGPGPHGGRVYRVRVGPFPTREEAERVAERLKTREKLQPWVVPPGK